MKRFTEYGLPFLGLVAICVVEVAAPLLGLPVLVTTVVFIGSFLPLLAWVALRNVRAYRVFAPRSRAAHVLEAAGKLEPGTSAFADNSTRRYRYRLIQSAAGISFVLVAVVQTAWPHPLLALVSVILFVVYLYFSEWSTGHLSKGDIEIERMLEGE